MTDAITLPRPAAAGLEAAGTRFLGRVAPRHDEVEREAPRLRLAAFVREAWPVLIPGSVLRAEWYVDCIAEHLEACHLPPGTPGRIDRLLVNMPPRAAKSTTISVMWNAWAWTEWPWLRWLFNSYAHDLSMRDALATRRLIDSSWYQTRWGHLFQLTDDQNRKERYDNTRMGYRISSSVTGQNTGEGGDITVADDPHNVLKGESEPERETVLTWHREVMPTRVTDFEAHVDVVVMQRVHEKDLSGEILADHRGYHHLCLPGEYVAKYTYVPGSDDVVDDTKPQPHKDCPVYPDPRTEEGEPLDRQRFTPAILAQLKHDLKTYAYSGQVQQRPVPRTGAVFSDEMWRPLPESFDRPNQYGVSQRQALVRLVYFDLSYSDRDDLDDPHDHAAGVVLGMNPAFDAFVLNVWRVMQPFETLAQEAADWLAALRPSSRPEMIYVEDAAFRRPRTQNFCRVLRDLLRAMGCPIAIQTVKVDTSKLGRAGLVADHGKVGQLFADRDAPWWTAYQTEHLAFPKSDEDDQVDATSGALKAGIQLIALQPSGGGPVPMRYEEEPADPHDVQAWLDSAFDSRDRAPGGYRR